MPPHFLGLSPHLLRLSLQLLVLLSLLFIPPCLLLVLFCLFFILPGLFLVLLQPGLALTYLISASLRACSCFRNLYCWVFMMALYSSTMLDHSSTLTSLTRRLPCRLPLCKTCSILVTPKTVSILCFSCRCPSSYAWRCLIILQFFLLLTYLK